MQLCNHGDHVVADRTLYGGTFALLKDFLPLKAGITTTFVDSRNLESVRAAITPMRISPLQQGAGIVVHSLTKFMNVASNII